jgi:hypothetical protein
MAIWFLPKKIFLKGGIAAVMAAGTARIIMRKYLSREDRNCGKKKIKGRTYKAEGFLICIL